MCYAGRVQGVGFRRAVAQMARTHNVRGYVKNLPNGTVELVASGGHASVAALRAEIRASFADNVTAEHADDLTPGPRSRPFFDFQICT
ncbi:MAG: acylphosphatase [Planctomycetota bacterium]